MRACVCRCAQDILWPLQDCRGIEFLHPRQKLEECVRRSPVDVDGLAFEIKRPWAEHNTNWYKPHRWQQTRGDSCLSPPLRQCAWMKVTVKMHAASLVWCGITDFSFAPLSSPCSNFGFGSFSEMLLLISVAAGRIQDPVLPRRVSRYWPEWECAPPNLVYGAKHRESTLRISLLCLFYFIYIFWQPTEGRRGKKSRNPCWHWGWRQKKKKKGLSCDFSGCFGVSRGQNGKRTMIFLFIYLFYPPSFLLVCAEALCALTYWGRTEEEGGGDLSVVLKSLFLPSVALLKLIRI